MNNFIISTYLTTAIDPQRNEVKLANDAKYIQKWYDSIVHLNLNGVLLHDRLSADFQRKFPRITFKQVDPVPQGMQLYDSRWVLYYEFLLNNPCNAVFFTDVSDVKVVRDPFYEFEEDILYCGDETERLNECIWIHNALGNPYFSDLSGFKELLSSDRVVLNCGLFGGSYGVVMQFLDIIVRMIEHLRFRPQDKTCDMPLFNYIAYRWFDFKHGFPVNSVFKGYENRNDVWFIHK